MGQVLPLMIALALGAAPARPADDTPAADRMMQAAAALAPHHQYSVPDDDPAVPGLLHAEWEAMGAWAADYLTRHPGARHAEAARTAPATDEHPAFDNAITADFLAIGHGVTIVATDDAGVGTVFALTTRGPPQKPVWRVTDAAARHAATMPALADWRAEQAHGECDSDRPHQASCRPLSARLGRLPPAADGSPRFYTEATYAQDMGATMGEQFAVWRWTGTAAEPLLVRTYAITADQSFVVRVHGRDITLRVKDEWRHFGACGSCLGRQADWRFRLTPTGARDLGKRSRTPELDRVDALFDRAFAGKPAGDIATPAAAAIVGRQAAAIRREARKTNYPDLATYIGMVMSYRITLAGTLTHLCVDWGEVADRVAFRGAQIIAVRPTAAGACDGPSARN